MKGRIRTIAVVGLATAITGGIVVSVSASPGQETAAEVPLTARPAGDFQLLASEPAPGGASREFRTDFSRHTVPYNEILTGGPPKDGIPPVDNPQYLSVADADRWLQPTEPVAAITAGDHARAFPIQVLTWHEIVNDTVGELPVTVTYCPLCNTAIAFDRRFDDLLLDFGTTGRLHFSNLIMYDRQTETWWQQATGTGIAGQYTGSQLAFVPLAMISWQDFKSWFPDGDVVSNQTGHSRNYGQNPYPTYDAVGRRPFLFQGPRTPDVLPQMARVLSIELGGEAVAYPYEALRGEQAVNDHVGGTPVAVLWAAGTASALDNISVAGGRDVGAATSFSRELGDRVLEFTVAGGQIVDTETKSVWNHLGRATGGELEGSQLTPVVGVNHFWFSWVAFRPQTRVYGASATSTG